MKGRGTALAAILAETGHKQAWLAKRISLHPSSVSRWVRGSRPLPPRYVGPIAAALGVEPEKLSPDVGRERR